VIFGVDPFIVTLYVYLSPGIIASISSSQNITGLSTCSPTGRSPSGCSTSRSSSIMACCCASSSGTLAYTAAGRRLLFVAADETSPCFRASGSAGCGSAPGHLGDRRSRGRSLCGHAGGSDPASG
jgi:hypothetical protein